MPSTEKKEKSDLIGAVDSFLSGRRKKKEESGSTDDPYNPKFLNIIEYIEKFKLFPYGLFPVQKFVLKLYYNLPLEDKLPDDESKRIKVRSSFRSKKFKEMTEVQYLEYLFSQNRCNIKIQDGKERRELILVLGRRSGKSALSSIIGSYELYKLLRRGCPQKFYGMPVTSKINVMCVANDKDQAGIVYDDINGHVNNVDYFRTSIANDTVSFMKFRTEHDKEKFGEDGRSTITATFKSSVAKGLRGKGVMVIILDELAFFVNDGKSSAEEIYRAIIPATKQFTPKSPKNRHEPIGPSEGRVISISSPDARDGHFYNLYQRSLTGGPAAANMLMIQAPTWEVNPTLSVEDYEIEHAKNPSAFETEYGAKFSDRVRGWIEDKNDLIECCDPQLKPLPRGTPREPFFAGLDFGISKDGTSLSLSHFKNGKITLAYHEIWYPGKSWKETNPHLTNPMVPYAYTLEDVRRLDIDEIVKWLIAVSKRFYIYSGVFDQWAGPIFEQKLHKNGLTQFEMKHFSTADASQVYSNAKMMMFTRQLCLYDYPIPEPSSVDLEEELHSPHIKELLELQAKSGGKNIIVVESPQVEGKHDDFSDSLVRSLFKASEYLKENPDILDLSRADAVQLGGRQRSMGYRQYKRQQQRMHGGYPKERRIPGR